MILYPQRRDGIMGAFRRLPHKRQGEALKRSMITAGDHTIYFTVTASVFHFLRNIVLTFHKIVQPRCYKVTTFPVFDDS